MYATLLVILCMGRVCTMHTLTDMPVATCLKVGGYEALTYATKRGRYLKAWSCGVIRNVGGVDVQVHPRKPTL